MPARRDRKTNPEYKPLARCHKGSFWQTSRNRCNGRYARPLPSHFSVSCDRMFARAYLADIGHPSRHRFPAGRSPASVTPGTRRTSRRSCRPRVARRWKRDRVYSPSPPKTISRAVKAAKWQQWRSLRSSQFAYRAKASASHRQRSSVGSTGACWVQSASMCRTTEATSAHYASVSSDRSILTGRSARPRGSTW
jgi:hypothetical protein